MLRALGGSSRLHGLAIRDMNIPRLPPDPTPAPHGTRPVLAANQVPIFVYGCIQGSTTKKMSSPCPHRGHHMHFARPPAPRSLPRQPPISPPSMAVPRRGFSAQSPRRHLKSAKSNTTTLMFALLMKAKWDGYITTDTDPINSRVSGAGQFACFGLPLRERPCLGGKCQQARGCSWAFASVLGSS